jgi:multidrug resistance efflux pump
VQLSFAREGQVEAVLVSEGETVVAGQPLARLGTNDLELAIDAAEAALATARARLKEASAGPRAEEVAVEEANVVASAAALDAAVARLDQLWALPRSASVAEAEAQVARAEYEELVSRDRHDQRIADEHLGMAEEHARYEWYTDQKELAAAQAQLEEVQEGAPHEEIREAEAAWDEATALHDQARAQLDLLLAGPRDETLAVLESQAKEAEIALSQARSALDKTVLTAPLNGTVVSLMTRPHEIAMAKTPVVVLADLTRFQIRAVADELYLPFIRPGQPATISFDALPGRQYSGEVAAVALRPTPDVAAEEGSTYTVIIALEKAHPELRWGMTAIVKIATENSE